MITVSNEELEESPYLEKEITCKICGNKHKVEYAKDSEGNESKTLQFFKCGEKSYICGINGKDIRK